MTKKVFFFFRFCRDVRLCYALVNRSIACVGIERESPIECGTVVEKETSFFVVIRFEQQIGSVPEEEFLNYQTAS